MIIEKRKIIQLYADADITLALCNDGTTWYLYDGAWNRLPDVPQPLEENDESK